MGNLPKAGTDLSSVQRPAHAGLKTALGRRGFPSGALANCGLVFIFQNFF
jgi:hypothetical protein